MISLFLALVFGPSLLVTLLTYTVYCYEECNQSGKPLRPFLSLAFRTTVNSFLSESLVLFLFPLGLWPNLWKKPKRSGNLIILVHGLFHNQSAWMFFRRWLHLRGYATACYSYPSWKTDWSKTVQDLESYLNDLFVSNPQQDIHLVGHSMGGLLLRDALARMDVPPKILTLTTLGTPFRGSKLSPFALNSLGRYLDYCGETVKSVAAQPHPDHVRALAIRSLADNMVLPNVSLRCGLPGWCERECAAVSHVAMLHDKGVFKTVLAWIREAEETVTTAHQGVHS